MNTNELKKFAQTARRQLIEQVGARLELVLHMDSAELREKEKAVKDLQEQITKTSKDAVVERVAYIWFNRFCALRFMDVNRYTKVGAVSPAEGFSQPEILQEAKQGYIDEELQINQQKVFDLLSGKAVSSDPQQEAYRLLLVAVCNSYHKLMPFMFERIADYTELLMPEDLLSENSILHAARNSLHEENCQDVEVIGWLYQFYISEKKDQVFDGLKKNKKITPENIPAATQLFTPHWIVRYLVENSLGRLWMLNRPQSQLTTIMEYYIKPEEPETDFLKLNSPEDIKICDPACGSGHMLTYTFDLLYSIYEEEGYDLKEIPGLILSNNLFGVEIDERAGALAAFALTMKGREKYRRFFRKPVLPNICVLQNVVFDDGEIKSYMDAVGRDLFTMSLQNTLHQFGEADNFGSLIRPDETNVKAVYSRLDAKGLGSNMFLMNTHQKVLQVLKQADFLSPKYHVVIANPPYMGGKGMNGRLGAWAKDNYPNSKSDLFAMFIERGLKMVPDLGYSAMVTMQSWMFLSSFEKLRTKLLTKTTIKVMAHMANMVMGIAFGTVATVWKKQGIRESEGMFCYVEYDNINKNNEPNSFPPKNERNLAAGDFGFYRASANDFRRIPGSPVAYWVDKAILQIYEEGQLIGDIATPCNGMNTTNNDKFVRNWNEISSNKIGFGCSSAEDALKSRQKWFPYNKGGGFRKWYGNNYYVVNYENNGKTICDYIDYESGSKVNSTGRVINRAKYFKKSITWSSVTSSVFSSRCCEPGFVFDNGGSSVFTGDIHYKYIAAFLGTKLAFDILRILNPTLNFQPGNLSSLPISIDKLQRFEGQVNEVFNGLMNYAKYDWNSSENSWDFATLPLLGGNCRLQTLEKSFAALSSVWENMTREMQQLEEENNRIFIEAYDLQGMLTPQVPINEISLTCNPHYRYGGGKTKTKTELQELLLADTMKEFISYSVGCMLGRYSLDKPGLILANQGETITDYLEQIPGPSFKSDTDNVIPILDGEWFIDDITERFRKFLKITFGDKHYEENLKFLEGAIGKDIRKYFLKDFYTDHVKRYKKRPIYWLFSSPKGSFNALIYMHRYRPDTVSIVLNDYLREFRTKLISRREHLEAISISGSAAKIEKTKALKEIEKLKKIIVELDDYERDTLYPLATQKIEIDLDDGVKANYPKFGNALKKVPGLS